MLSAIREKTQGIFAVIIVGLLIIPFAFWGVNEYFDSAGNTIIANVNGIEIDENNYRDAVDSYRGRVDPRTLDNPMFKRQVAETLVQRALVRDALDAGGYAVSNQQLGALIRNLPQFQLDGKFSDERYRAALRGSGQTVAQFESSMRQNKMLDQIVGSFKDSVIVSSADEQRILSLKAQTRHTEIITIEPGKFSPNISISDDEIKNFYEQQKNAFQEPERVRISYIQLSAKELKQSFTPKEEDLKVLYDEEKGRYTKPGSRRVSHILIELESDADESAKKKALGLAKDIATKTKSGQSFAELARKYSADTESSKNGGDLGEVSPGLLPVELEAIVNKMREGQISDPVRTEFGYHVARLTSLKAPIVKSYKAVRSDLVKLLKDRKSEERFFDMAERFNNLVYEQSDNLDAAATALGLKVEKSGWFTRMAGTGIAADPKIRDAAFSADVKTEKRNSESIELASDRLVALRILDVDPAKQKSIQSVRSQIIAKLKTQRAEDQARKLGREIVIKARKGASLASLAKEHGLKQTPARPIKRDEKSVNKRLLDSVFAASRPGAKQKVIDGVDMGSNGFAVYSLSRVADGKPDSIASKEHEAIREQISKRKGTGFYQNYLSGLRQSGKIKIYYDKL